jgi:hypothetical protein
MFQSIKNGIASRLSPTREHWSALQKDFRNRLRVFRSNRSASLRNTLEQDFAQVLAAWGIDNEAEIPGIIHALRLRCLIFALPIILAGCAAILTRSYPALLTLILMALPCLLGILTTLWRMSILANRTFTPLSRWILSFIGVCRKRP